MRLQVVCGGEWSAFRRVAKLHCLLLPPLMRIGRGGSPATTTSFLTYFANFLVIHFDSSLRTQAAPATPPPATTSFPSNAPENVKLWRP